jgi:hypothetical protein
MVALRGAGALGGVYCRHLYGLSHLILNAPAVGSVIALRTLLIIRYVYVRFSLMDMTAAYSARIGQ